MTFKVITLTKVLVLLLASANAKAQQYQGPLPGLDDKPHLRGVKREDLALDLLFPYSGHDHHNAKNEADDAHIYDHVRHERNH